ncbi:MAG: UDP-glucose 4-epimerase GalE [Flavobacteriales bacterium]
MKQVLVTGGAGYIGSHTVVSLVEQGFYPVIVDDLRNSSQKILEGLSRLTNNRFSFFSLDVCDKEALYRVFESHAFDAVIHFAAHKSVGESCEIPLQYYQNNLIGLMNILEACHQFSVSKFVFSSSCTVYGEPDEKQVYESTPKRLPASPYGFTKWMGEQIIEDVHRNSVPFQTICLRYFNPIGAHSSGLIGELPVGIPNNLLPYITQTAAGIRSHLTVFGNDYPTSDGTCIRDYVHVSDVADAHVRALLFTSDKPLDVFNIGTGKGTSVLEMILYFNEVSGLDLPYQIGPRRSGDITEIFANVSYSNTTLGWRAKRNVKEALKDAWNWEKCQA